jgi:hypothetical protein
MGSARTPHEAGLPLQHRSTDEAATAEAAADIPAPATDVFRSRPVQVLEEDGVLFTRYAVR